MRRWNGWGDNLTRPHLSENAQAMLAELVGTSSPGVTSSLEEILKQVPASKLPQHPLVDTSPETRLRHARGQSFPDWVDMRFGTVNSFPDGVAFPLSRNELTSLLTYARDVGARVIPYGGGTSVVGHLTPQKGDAPVLTISMVRLCNMVHFSEKNHLATFGAGIAGPDLEAALRVHGFTLGHYPQSFEYSTLGGWVVTRSSGQQSLGYGRIEDTFAGGRLISPGGDLVMPPLAASAAGPDLRQLVLGSEGRMGILDEVTIRVRRIPEREVFHTCFFPNWDLAVTAVRQLAQSDIPLSMMRLSNSMETQTNLALAGRERTIGYLKSYLRLRGVADDACMLLLGFTGTRKQVKQNRSAALSLCRDKKAVHLHQPLGKAWYKNRFKAPYLRNTLWDLGYAVDTLETCLPWEGLTEAVNTIESSIRDALKPFSEDVHVFTHLSHFYPSGCSVYTTYLWRLKQDPQTAMAHWQALKGNASNKIVSLGGTISHQHGVGLDHRPYMIHEKTAMGMETLRRVFKQYDPDNMMNPGKLITDSPSDEEHSHE